MRARDALLDRAANAIDENRRLIATLHMTLECAGIARLRLQQDRPRWIAEWQAIRAQLVAIRSRRTTRA
jgi:hypothetical protein